MKLNKEIVAYGPRPRDQKAMSKYVQASRLKKPKSEPSHPGVNVLPSSDKEQQFHAKLDLRSYLVIITCHLTREI